MTGSFKVGEVCIGQNLPMGNASNYNGCECVIIEGPLVTSCVSVTSGEQLPPEPRYVVEWSDGIMWLVAPRFLRRKQPPTGLSSILRMFDLTAPAPREVEAA